MGMVHYVIADERIQDLSRRVAHVHATSSLRIARDFESVHAELDALRRDVGELALVTRSVVTLLVEKGLVTREELAERTREVDAEDGVEDGTLGDG